MLLANRTICEMTAHYFGGLAGNKNPILNKNVFCIIPCIK